jgi:hypothetical protein
MTSCDDGTKYSTAYPEQSALINELARLRAQLEMGQKHGDALQRIGTALGLSGGDDLHQKCVPEIARLRAEIAELRADAERYRWLRNADRRRSLTLTGPEAGVWCDCESDTGELMLLTEDDLDAGIDAARKD